MTLSQGTCQDPAEVQLQDLLLGVSFRETSELQARRENRKRYAETHGPPTVDDPIENPVLLPRGPTRSDLLRGLFVGGGHSTPLPFHPGASIPAFGHPHPPRPLGAILSLRSAPSRSSTPEWELRAREGQRRERGEGVGLGMSEGASDSRS